jgi:hypothetical protein
MKMSLPNTLLIVTPKKRIVIEEHHCYIWRYAMTRELTLGKQSTSQIELKIKVVMVIMVGKAK